MRSRRETEKNLDRLQSHVNSFKKDVNKLLFKDLYNSKKDDVQVVDSEIHELRETSEPTLRDLVEKFDAVDLLLVEGFKREGHKKIEVFRKNYKQELLSPGDKTILAVAGDGPIDGLKVPLIDLNNVPAIADFILEHTNLKNN